MRPAYFWVIAAAISWPLVAFVVTFLRFGELPGNGEQIAAALLGFVLVGVISGLVLISVLRRTTNRSGKVLVIAGYILAAPFGYVFGVVGPLTLEVFVGTSSPASVTYFLLFPLTIGLYGSVPPVCVALAGFLIARTRERGT